MKKAFPGIFKRGETFWYRFTHNRTQRFVSLRTKDEVEAINLAKRIRANPELAGAGSWDAEKKEYLNYLELNNHRERSIRVADEMLSTFKKWCIKHSIKTPAKLTTRSCKTFLRDVGCGQVRRTKKGWPCTTATMRTYYSRLKNFFEFLVKYHHGVRVNPWLGIIELPNWPGEEKIVLTAAEVHKLLNNCKRKDLKFILFCGLHAGMRKNEVVNATPSWFNLQTGFIKIPAEDSVGGRTFKPKGTKEKQVPISPEFHSFLVRNKNFLLSGHYCVGNGSNGKRYRYDFRKPFENYCQSQGVEISFHELRHTFVSHAITKNRVELVGGWTGDRIETLEKNYIKSVPRKGDMNIY